MTLTNERILTNDLISIASLGVTRSGRWRGYCPFHTGSTAFDLEIARDFSRFYCIACGATGWTESGYRRHRAREARRRV